MKRKNNPKSTSKPPNKQPVSDGSDDDEKANFPSQPGSSLESVTLDKKTKDQSKSKSKATPAETKGKRGRPKGSKNTKAEKESKAKGSAKSKKNSKEEPEVISEDEENVSENEDAEELPGTQEAEDYEHEKITEVIDLEEDNETKTVEINKFIQKLETKTLNVKNPPPTMEEEKEESKVPENPEEDISIEASEEENKNNTQEETQEDHDDQEPCQICYSKVSQKFLQPETRHLFKIIRCKECKIAVHRICVGKEAVLSKKVSEFVCDSCQSGVKTETKKYKCQVCSTEDGYLHHASSSKWCHLLCAISSSNIFIKDVANMTIDISSFKKEVGKIPNGHKCTICQVKVGTLRSTDKDNGHFCHLHCALREAKLKPKNANWSANFRLVGTTAEEYEENQTVIKNVDIRSQVVIQNIEEIQSKLNSDITKNIQDKLDSKDKSPKKKGKTNEEVAPAISKIFEKVKKTFARRFNIPVNQPESKSFELDHFSGKLIFTEKFRSHKDDMEVEDDENPLSGNSKKLASQLISFLSDELTNEDSLYETSHALVPTGRVVKGHLPAFQPMKSVSLPEVLFFVNIFQKRIEAATRNICEEGSLIEIFNLAQMIPFAVTGLLTPVYEKFYTSIAADHLMAKQIGDCSPLEIYNPLTKAFDQNNLRKNAARLDHAESLKKTYFNKPCQIITTQTLEVHSLIHQLRFLTEEFYNDLKDIFASKDAPSNASSLRATPLKVGSLTPVKGQLPDVPDYKVVKLYERANEVGLPKDSEEMKLMDWYIKKSKFASAVVEEQSVADVSPAPSPDKRMQEESESPQKLTPSKLKLTPSKYSTSKLLLRDIEDAFPSPSPNKGKISQPRIVVNLPPRDGLVKKPQYLTDDRDWIGKEKEYEVQLKLLQSKSKLEEIEDQLASLNSPRAINQRQTTQRKKERALTWKKSYLDALRKNDGSLKKVIDDIDTIDIYLDEMKEAYEHRLEWAHCRIKVELLTKKFREEHDPIDFATLEEVVKEGQQIPQCEPDEGDKFGTLQGRYQTAQKMQRLLATGADEYGDPLKENHLKAIELELRRQKVKIPEKHLLDEKLAVNKTINELRNETLTTEELEKKINEVSVHFSAADESFVEQLKQRLETAKDLSRQAVALIEGYTRYNLQDLSRMANLVQQARDERLIVAKVGVLENIVNTYLLFEKVRSIFLNTQAITFEKLQRGEFMETEEQPEDLIQELDNKLSQSELESDQVEELRRLCYGVKLDDLTSFEALYNFFQKLLTIIRRGEAKNILNREYKRAQEIEDFLASLPKNLELPEQERQLFREIEKEGAKISAWKNAVHEFLKTKPKDKIKNIYERAGDEDLDLGYINDELDNLTQEIERLTKWYKNDLEAYQDLDEETSQLNRLSNWTESITQGLELRNRVENDKYTNLDDIEGLIDTMRGAGLPADDGLGGLLNSWCDEVRKVKKDFDLKYGRKKDFGSVENTKVRDLIRKNASKPSKADADAMIDTIESVKKYATLDREVNTILSDMQQLKLWVAKIKEAIELYKDLYEEGDMEIEQEDERNKLRGKQEEISKKLTELKTEMMGLTLRDEKGETSLLLFEWICDAVFLLNGLKKDAKYEEWKSLMDIQETFEREEAKKVQHLTQRLEKAFLGAQNITEFVEKLQHLTKTLETEEANNKIEMIEDDQRRESFENIEAMIADCDKCQVPMRETKRDLEAIYNKCKLTKKQAQDYLKSTHDKKITLSDIESLQKRIRGLPVNLFEEYRALDDIIVEANRIQIEVGKVAARDSIKTEELIARYQNCPVSLPSMKRLMEFKENFNKLKAVEEQLEDLSDNQLTYDDLGKIDEIRSGLESRIDEAYSDTLRKYIFIKRCKIIQKIKEEGTSDFRLTYTSLKDLRIDGGDLKEKFPEDTAVIEAFRFLNDIWRKAEDKIKDIEQIQDADKLSGISKIVAGIVDIEEKIIDKRAKLTARPLQNNIQPFSKFNLQYTEPAEERKDAEPVKRKRGRPRKGEEKHPRKETTAERDRKSKEKSRNREKSDNVMRKKREEASSSNIRSAPKEIRTIGHYYAKNAPPSKEHMILNVGPTSNKESILRFIKQIFDLDGAYLHLEGIQAIKIGEEILKIYPVVLESGRHQQALRKKLQNLLKYKAIATRLFTEKNCLRNNFKIFVKKSNDELQTIEKKQQQRFIKNGRTLEHVVRRPLFDKENIRDTRDPIPREFRKEKPVVLQDKKNKPTTVNEKQYKVHKDPGQTTLKYETKRSGENIRASQEYMDTGYDAFNSQPAAAVASKLSRSNTRTIHPEPILRESALKLPIRKKGQLRDNIPEDEPVAEFPPITADFNYDDIPTRLEERFNDGLNDSIRPTTQTPEPRHDNIYRILEGSLENVDGTQKLKMALFTCDDSKKISRIPQFTDTDPLKIKFKKHKNKVEDYFNNVLNEDSGIRIISGWVENRISIYQSRCEQIAQDFLNTDTIGTTTYDHKSTRILFLHKDQINSTWKSKLKFRTKRLTKTSNPILCFIIITRADRLTRNTRYITPVVEKQLGTTPRKGSFDSLDSLDSLADWEEELSQASSIGDYEPDFGQLVEPRNIPYDQTSIESGGEDDERPGKPGLNRHGKRGYLSEYSEDEDEYRPKKKIQVDKNFLNELREKDPEEVMDFIADLDDDERDAYKKALRAMALEEGEDLEPLETEDYTDEEARTPEPTAPVNPIDSRYPIENLIQEQRFFELQEPKPRNRFPFLFNPENQAHFFDEPAQSTLPIVMNQNPGLRQTQPFRFEEDSNINTPSRQLQGHKKGNFGGNKFHNTGKKSGNKNNQRFNKNNNRKFNKGKGGNNNNQAQSNVEDDLNKFVGLIKGAKLEGGKMLIPKSLFEELKNVPAQIQQAEFTSATIVQSADSSINPSQEFDRLHAPLSSFKDPNEENK